MLSTIRYKNPPQKVNGGLLQGIVRINSKKYQSKLDFITSPLDFSINECKNIFHKISK